MYRALSLGKRYQKITLFVLAFYTSKSPQGILSNKLYASSTTASDVSTCYLGTKSHIYCTVCGKEEHRMPVILGQARAQLKKNIYIILYEKARASPCHFVDRELKYSAKILSQSYSRYKSIFRGERTTYKLSEAFAEI